MRIEAFWTADAPPGLLTELRTVCSRAFEGEFTPADWDHALGGRHVAAFAGDIPVAHAAVVPRVLEVDGRSFQAGYVEAVATDPEYQGRGFGALVMAEVTRWVPSAHELGALATGEWGFYGRWGWERWIGPTFVRAGGVVHRSEEDDDAVMVLRFGPSEQIDLRGSIVCEARQGDDW